MVKVRNDYGSQVDDKWKKIEEKQGHSDGQGLREKGQSVNNGLI